MTLSSLPGPWRWEKTEGEHWWRVHDALGIHDGPHPEPVRVAEDDIMPDADRIADRVTDIGEGIRRLQDQIHAQAEDLRRVRRANAQLRERLERIGRLAIEEISPP